MPGPVPKRSEDRIRRNIPTTPVDRVHAVGAVQIPDLDIEDAHPKTINWYESLKISAQSKYYEPSDWAEALIVCHFLDELLKSSKPSALMLSTVEKMMSNLLTTEGERRRMHMEIVRGSTAEEQEANEMSKLMAGFRKSMENL